MVVAVLLALGTSPLIVAADGSPFHVGQYAIYGFGDECYPPTTPVFSPMFDYAGKIFLYGCPVELRWDVIDVSGGVALIRLGMDGWSRSDIYGGNATVLDRVYVALTTEHILHVDSATMDTKTSDGTPVGRFSWLLTPAEVAAGKAELVRNWYEGRTISANVTLTQELLTGEWTEAGRQGFGIQAFVSAATALHGPFPTGLDNYTVNQGGGWKELLRSIPIHHPTKLLLLFTLGAFYSDIFYNLYGIIWQDAYARPWADFPHTWSTMTLTATNMIELPGSEPDEGGEGGVANDTGSGPGPSEPRTTGSQSQAPWLTIGLFAIAATAVGILALRLFRPGKKSR